MNSKTKQLNRVRRHKRVRSKIIGTSNRPRVSIFRSNNNIFIQLIDDAAGKTIISNNIISSAKNKSKVTKANKALEIGKDLAKKAKEAGIEEIVFDRGGYKYHGRVKALADGLREGGLKF